MRPRKEIEQDGRIKEDLQIEVLLDIRDLLLKQGKAANKKTGRPKKIK